MYKGNIIQSGLWRFTEILRSDVVAFFYNTKVLLQKRA